MNAALDQSQAPSTKASPAGGFGPTQWSVVMAAGLTDRDSRVALEKLCRAYWQPVFYFVRRQGETQETAEDLTQEFFHQLLAGGTISTASPEKGRFRSWLIGSLKHFLLNDWRKNNAIKRGGKYTIIPLEGMTEAQWSHNEPRTHDTPESAFDKKWAETLLAKAQQRLEREYKLAEQTDRYEALKPFLMPGSQTGSYADAAASIGISEEAMKSAIYKFRQRFGKLLKHEVAQTVVDPADADEELRFLVVALRS